MAKKIISFFMGSGFSVPAGFPLMHEIETRICFSSFVNKVNNNFTCITKTKDYLFFFNIINKYLAYNAEKIEFISGKKPNLNYESAYYEINRLFKIMKGDSDELSYPILRDLQTVLSVHRKDFEDKEYFKHILESYCENISEHVLDFFMSRNPKNSEKYDGFVQFLKRLSERKAIDSFFTTNYDLVIETLLREQGMNYHENFKELSNDDLPTLSDGRDMIKLFDSKMNCDNETPRLLKLHGSIDNFSLSEKIKSLDFQKRHLIKCQKQHEFKQKLEVNSNFQIIMEPELLIGTKNKLEEYHQFYYTHTFNGFLRCIERTQILVVIGYGFGDFAINRMLWGWLSNNEPAKMFIIDMSDTLDNFAENKHNPKLFHQFNSIERGKKLLYFNGGVENANYEQILEDINKII